MLHEGVSARPTTIPLAEEERALAVSQCRLRVIRVGLTGSRRLPVYPGERIFSG
jgi:hypothetical protein